MELLLCLHFLEGVFSVSRAAQWQTGQRGELQHVEGVEAGWRAIARSLQSFL